MEAEGRGKVRPTPIHVELSLFDVLRCWRESQRRNAARNYRGRQDQWGRGLTDAADPVFCGCLAEMAYAHYLGIALGIRLDLDTTERERGDDGYDLCVAGIRLQVKDRITSPDALVRRCSGGGRIVPLKWDICCFATTPPSECRPGRRPGVSLDGWIWKWRFKRICEHRPSPLSNHTNLYVAPEELEPVCRLAPLLRSKILLAREGRE